MLIDEQVESIKEQLIKHIEKGFPAEQQEFAIQQILSMNPEQLEEFLKQNNLSAKENESVQCIFCSIVKEKTKSFQITENEEAIAVLEINPVSKGHTLIIPKNHSSDSSKDFEKGVKELINSVSDKIKEKLKPKKIMTENKTLFGHPIINLIPNYENDGIVSSDSKRSSARKEELEELQKILAEETRPSVAELKKKIIKKSKPQKINLKKEKLLLPKRIP